eukprot:gb/GECG01007641.1/.p1 GENE.gb/GECG01007641.1/~~gb/GECG01007641.1/.p1  ORF type:complete len:401 (+),score=49.82 gb/GECG01007641.1/:1-1203(+)
MSGFRLNAAAAPGQQLGQQPSAPRGGEEPQPPGSSAMKPEENGNRGAQESQVISTVVSQSNMQPGESGDSKKQLEQANKRVEELEERVRVAEAQVASHWELLRRLYDVILVFDMSGIIIFASPACEEVLGYSQKELFNRPLAAILAESFHQDFEAKVRSMIKIQTQRALKGKELFMNAKFVRKSGQEVWLEGLGQAWQLENVVELVFSFREHPPDAEDFSRPNNPPQKAPSNFHPPTSQGTGQPMQPPPHSSPYNIPAQQPHYPPSSGPEGMRPPPSSGGYPSDQYPRGQEQMPVQYMNNMHAMYYGSEPPRGMPQPQPQPHPDPQPHHQMPHPMYNHQPHSGMPMHTARPYQAYMPQQQFWGGPEQVYGMMGAQGRPMPQQQPRHYPPGPDSSGQGGNG